jgi:hypothetical protein
MEPVTGSDLSINLDYFLGALVSILLTEYLLLKFHSVVSVNH